jgi:hypothetical protein
MRIGHVSEMYVCHRLNYWFRSGAFHSGVIENHPEKLHSLNRQKKPYHRHVGVLPFDEQRSSRVINGKHGAFYQRGMKLNYAVALADEYSRHTY